MSKLSRGLEWLIKEQDLTPKPKRQPLEKLEEVVNNRKARQITVANQKVLILYKRFHGG